MSASLMTRAVLMPSGCEHAIAQHVAVKRSGHLADDGAEQDVAGVAVLPLGARA